MEKQNLRLFLLLALAAVGMFLYSAWQQEHTLAKQHATTSAQAAPATHDLPSLAGAPSSEASATSQTEPVATHTINPADVVTITTDVMRLQLSRVGGDIIYLELLQYPLSQQEPDQGFVMLSKDPSRNYIVQSGMLSQDGPDSPKRGRAAYTSAQPEYTLQGDQLIVDLEHKSGKNINTTKRFIFNRGSYSVGVEYLVRNGAGSSYSGVFYGRLRRSEPESSGTTGMATKTYTGAAITTPEQKYVKVSFADMSKKGLKKNVSKGWAAMTEHYFTSAWIPGGDAAYQYHSETFADNTFSIGFVGQPLVVAPGEQGRAAATLYMGPGITKDLQALAPGLELTVDYGVLWWICQPIFQLMTWLHSLVSNWGAAIILVTVLIKLAFYKLSAASYRSMGNMRKLQPKMEELKARCGDDRQKYGQAVMELYKKEKINPLGGCLPILVQIPVFIALYYVLLESVELRQAPFMLWIHDLSAKDPFYVLPLIMGVSMFFQQRMNPAPPDPVQAKVMMAMPVVFTALFLQFPSGLVLYWVVNNVLSIAQQWMITRRMGVITPSKPKTN